MLVLASASPRRRALLAEAGIDHRVVPVRVDETPPPGLDPTEVAPILSERKARAVPPGDAPIIAADTIVVLDGQILGKPMNRREALAMIGRLSGRTHRVVTGVCLLDPATGRLARRAVTTEVTFRDLTAEEIEEYVATGEPFDKAGGYGIQGAAGRFVSKIDGPLDNVVGLPLSAVREMLRELG